MRYDDAGLEARRKALVETMAGKDRAPQQLKSAPRSLAHTYGCFFDRVADKTDEARKANRVWCCIANNTCARKGEEFEVNQSITKTTCHLKNAHRLVSEQSGKIASNKQAKVRKAYCDSKSFDLLLQHLFSCESPKLRQLGLADDGEAAAARYERTPRLSAEEEVQFYLRGMDGFINEFGIVLYDKIMDFWTHRTVREKLPGLSAVAMALFGHPASAAQIERDFGNATIVLRGHRNRLDPAFLDILLMLRANRASIPATPTIPKLEREPRGVNQHKAIPSRLRTVEELDATERMSQTLMAARRPPPDSDVEDSDEE